MREIKDQTDGRTYDRLASFQFIHDRDMVTEKSVHTIREDNIFPHRIYEIQEAVTCSSTKMVYSVYSGCPQNKHAVMLTNLRCRACTYLKSSCYSSLGIVSCKIENGHQ